MHSLAICTVAFMFLASIKLCSEKNSLSHKQTVQEDLGIERLPGLSLANVKELLCRFLNLRRSRQGKNQPDIIQSVSIHRL